jgi:hypothetical protein
MTVSSISSSLSSIGVLQEFVGTAGACAASAERPFSLGFRMYSRSGEPAKLAALQVAAESCADIPDAAR